MNCCTLTDAYVIVMPQVLEKAAEDEEKLDGHLDDECEELIYGEFSLALFCALLDKLAPCQTMSFIDVGSGRGQLVLAAASGDCHLS